MLEIERILVEKFGWSLHDIDRTDIDSLIPFILRLSGEKPATGDKRVYADQVDWL